MIKTNQILVVGWSLSVGKIWKKTLNESEVITEAKYTLQSENQQNQHRPSASFTFHVKKDKRSPEDKVE